MESKQQATMQARALTIIGIGRALELAVSESGLTSARFRALSLVDAGITSSGLLAQFLDVTPSTVTTVMDGLVAEKLVERLRSTQDRRRVDYELTDDGATVLHAANERAMAAVSSLADTLEIDERVSAFAGLDLWTRAIDNRRRNHWGSEVRP